MILSPAVAPEAPLVPQLQRAAPADSASSPVAAQPTLVPLAQDRIAGSPAGPSPLPKPSDAKPPVGVAAVPFVVTAGLLVGAAVLAPELVAGGAALTEDAAGVGSLLVRARPFVAAAGRAFAAEYRSAAAGIMDAKYTDSAQLGKVLGAQSWAATEELGRSSVVGAGLAGGAWLVHHALSAFRGPIAVTAADADADAAPKH